MNQSLQEHVVMGLPLVAPRQPGGPETTDHNASLQPPPLLQNPAYPPDSVVQQVFLVNKKSALLFFCISKNYIDYFFFFYRFDDPHPNGFHFWWSHPGHWNISYCIWNTRLVTMSVGNLPREEFELSANSLGAHIETQKAHFEDTQLHHSELTR